MNSDTCSYAKYSEIDQPNRVQELAYEEMAKGIPLRTCLIHSNRSIHIYFSTEKEAPNWKPLFIWNKW